MTRSCYIKQLYPAADNIAAALLKAQKQTVLQLTEDTYRDNLRHRTTSVSFDSKFRGALGESLMLSFFNDAGIKAQTLGSALDDNGDIDINVKGGIQEYSIEVKTSLLSGNMQSVGQQLDNYNLIVQKKHDCIEDDVTRDIHAQILFAVPRSDRDELVNRNEPGFKDEIFNMSVGDLYRRFDAQQLANNMYFAAWSTREEIVAYVNSIPPSDRTWGYSYQNVPGGGQVTSAMREYWKYPMREAFSPGVFARYIKETQWDRQHRHEQERNAPAKKARGHSRQGYSL